MSIFGPSRKCQIETDADLKENGYILMVTKATLETTLSFAASLEPGEWRDAILFHLEKMEYNSALMVCGDAVLAGLREETDLSLDELKKRMRQCGNYEKLEKMISSLARDLRDAKRIQKHGAEHVWPRRSGV